MPTHGPHRLGSALALRNAKPKEKAYKLFDGGDLHLLVNPGDSRIWRLACRFAGKPKQLSFGPYPTVSLADARQKREHAKKLLLNGEDPSVARKLDNVAAAISEGNTFERLAAEYIDRLTARDLASATITKNNGCWRALTVQPSASAPLPRSHLLRFSPSCSGSNVAAGERRHDDCDL